MKKIIREVCTIIHEEKSILTDNDYIISYDESNIKIIKVIFKAPISSEIYRHKFFRLDIHIDDEYPFVAPKVFFINHNNSRIHPILYEDGRTCMTILNTWYSENEKWSSSISIHSLIQTFISFITDNPYIHEPGGKGDDTYSRYVEYETWNTCFYQYLINEDDSKFRDYINEYIIKYNNDILKTMVELNEKISYDIITNMGLYDYTPCYEIDYYFTEMVYFLNYYKKYYNQCNLPAIEIKKVNIIDNNSNDSICQICLNKTDNTNNIKLECNHEFHLYCLKKQIEKTLEAQEQKVCGMCRRIICIKQKNNKIKSYESSIDIICNWEINPETKRLKRKRKRKERDFNL